MKIKNKSSQKPLKITLAIIAGLLLVNSLAWWYYGSADTVENKTSENSLDTSDDTPPSARETTEELPTKEDRPQEPGVSSPDTSSLDSTITVLEVEGDTLYVRNEIKGVYASGTCTLTLTHDSETVTRTADVQALAQVSTCKGFNVPTDQLTRGEWTATVTIEINDKRGSDTKKVAI